MNLTMVGLDYSRSPISLREQLSFTKSGVVDMDRRMKAMGCEGVVLLSTCNRTELYVSLPDGSDKSPEQLLCEAAMVDSSLFTSAFRIRSGEDCVRHLMEVSCGLRSQILGEDQILTQVKTALLLSREAGAADSILETLFRTAAACGKAVKTSGRLTALPTSAAHRAVEALRQHMGDLAGKKALVIGNGEMGRLAASLLRGAGCSVTVTLRSYRHGETVVPAGCSVVAYQDRYSAMEGKDLLLSATTSPHYTVSADEFSPLTNPPKFLVDLAIPRDIQPELPAICLGVTLLNVDDLQQHTALDSEALRRVTDIAQAHLERFYQWNNYRESLPALEEVKTAVLERVRELDTDEAVCKAIDLIMGGIKDGFTPETLSACAAKIRAHTR